MKSLRTYLSVAAMAAAIGLAGCSVTGTAPTGVTGTSSTGSSSSVSSGSASSGSAGTTTAVSLDTLAQDTHFDGDDLTWDTASEVAVTLADGASSVASGSSSGVSVDGDTVTISAAGTYRLSGSLTDGKIVVAAGEEDTVRVILDGATLANSTGSSFVVESADEAIVYLADGTNNSISDSATYADQGTDAPNAALYSKADLTIAGPGTLAVDGNYNDGISSKDGLVLAGGTVTVDAADDGIAGKDYAVLLDGAYQVTADDDGFKSDNEEDEGRGWVLVNGGTLAVTAGDDGVKAFNTLTIAAGDTTVKESEEGLEAQHIVVSGGTANITSNDDGVNASGGSSTASSGAGAGGSMEVGDYTVDISGGLLTINAQGDGLDSNGNATISGGTVVVNGPTNDGNGALDVNGELAVTGGTVAAAGSAGMAVTPGASSTQSGVQVTLGSSVPAGTVIQIADPSGTVVAAFVTTKAAASLVFSSAAITAGTEYTVYTGGTATVSAGLGEGSLDGATQVDTVTAGEYTAEQGPGGGGGGFRR
ncbi:carbohydrate-binding domain-containing protein [Pseudarthrobacter sp. SL88]|uniref:carbohydrate-binding domain-containing protein n=1 Tax=Pseudarthrobacter sp. SL88 TaxID=2994666 RepID=UPI0022762E32|nr:carbohydrate-binding domain-containing protein [Pseudarthrobacter sp. SL88]MCY1673558.1 carbohydrate-binding domain-containing protein [Pseudarthrobacter sp. SL88]